MEMREDAVLASNNVASSLVDELNDGLLEHLLLEHTRLQETRVLVGSAGKREIGGLHWLLAGAQGGS